MTSRKRGIATVTEVFSSSSAPGAKVARIGAPEHQTGAGVFSRAQLDLTDAIYRRAPLEFFRPVFLQRISTFYPSPWAAFNTAAQDYLSFDVRKHMDRFLSLPDVWISAMSTAVVKLSTTHGDKDEILSIKLSYHSHPPRDTSAALTNEILNLIMGSKVMPVRDSKNRVIQLMVTWIQMMFPYVRATADIANNEIFIDYAADYVPQIRALLIDAGVQHVEVVKNAQAH